MDFVSRIDTLIRARYPVIWIESYEETRLLMLIGRIAIEQNRELLVWSATMGLCKPRHEGGWERVKDGTDDPLNALDYIEDSKDKPVIAVLKDLHRYMDNNLVYRKIRDMHESLKATRKTLCILSPVIQIPVELQKSVRVETLPLPEKDELENLLQNSLDVLQKKADSGDEKLKEVMNTIHDQLGINGTKERVISAGLGLTLTEFEDVIMKSIVATRSLSQSEIVAEKEQIIRKSGILEFYTSLADMQDVGGLEALKAWIQKRKQAFSERARDFGLRTPKGVFLAGPPGTGKSLIAKVIAQYMQMPLLRLDMANIFASHVGESEQNISAALKMAEATAPSILWVDEIEKAMAGVQSSGNLDSGVTARVFGNMLTWMQEHKSPVFLVVTSNNPLAIPPEFMRAGRFDEVFFVDLPNMQERDAIFRIHISRVRRNPEDYDIQGFAGTTDGFSGAEIESVIQDALHEAFFNECELKNDFINSAISATTPLSKKRSTEIEQLRKWGGENATPSTASIEKRNAVRGIDL